MREPLLQQRPQERAEQQQSDQGRDPREPEGERIDDLAKEALAHTEESARRSSRSNMMRAMAITEKVMTNSSAPSAISEEE